MTAKRAIALVIAGLAVTSMPQSGFAQNPFEGMNVEGQVETGVRFFVDEPPARKRAKLEEYRDITQGVYLPGFDLRIFRPDESYSTEFGGSKWGQQDQEYFL